MENENNRRIRLFQYLDDVLSVSHKKFIINNKASKERRSWGRLLVSSISVYGKLLENEELELRVEELEKKLKDGVLIK